MERGLRPFVLTLSAVWVILCITGWLYARQRSIPDWIAIPVIAAFLAESFFYTAAGFEGARRLATPLRLLASAVLPYVIYSLATGVFRWEALAVLAAIAGAAAFWYVRLPRNTISDLLFLALAVTVVVTKAFPQIYARPLPSFRIEILGTLMWIRLGITVLLAVRGVENPGFGFFPRAREWRIGFLHFLAFLPIGAVLALALGFTRPHAPSVAWWKIAGVFAGMLWVVALGEEFFFRGVIQRHIAEWRGETTALVFTSVLFGAAHLAYGPFPNWRFALVASVAGLCYGHAYSRTRSVRASMVAHALVNTVWRTCFS